MYKFITTITNIVTTNTNMCRKLYKLCKICEEVLYTLHSLVCGTILPHVLTM